MSALTEMQCTVCHGTGERLSESEIEKLLQETPEWKMIELNGEKRLQRIFHFDNFKYALEFTNEVGEIAEANNHHPAMLTEWGKVTVTWWTHSVHGLHRNDFIMAAKSDEAYTDVGF